MTWVTSRVPLSSGAGRDPVVHIENLPCSRNHSFCEANVLLSRSLELGRVYDLTLRLRDTHGDVTSVPCTIRPTNTSTPLDTIFPHLPLVLVVPEVRLVAWAVPVISQGTKLPRYSFCVFVSACWEDLRIFLPFYLSSDFLSTYRGDVGFKSRSGTGYPDLEVSVGSLTPSGQILE